jgi:EAL domain-containing protein (putative c-di-GMP-specific phosphodiesterase class I)
VLADPTTTIEALRRVRELGVKTPLDDFGTVYSSLTYLKLLPVDELKIDRSFVADMVADTSSHALVASAVDLAHNLGLTVVAEGVEDDPTAAALGGLGCDTAQGYHFARPVPAAELDARFLGV